MKHPLGILFISCILLSCSGADKRKELVQYEMRDYLQVAEHFDSVGWEGFPYIIEISKGDKQLTFVGALHTRELTHQADSKENAFYRLRPQIAFNEGGQIQADKTFRDRNEAIRKSGETGHLKFLCDEAGIKVMNGDLTVSEEAEQLFKLHGRKNVLLYLSNERFFDLYAKGWIDTTAGLEKTYQKDFIGYLQRNKVELREEEKQFSYIKKAYEDYFQKEFDVHTIPADRFYFLEDGGKLCETGRSSKVVRDINLLHKIEEAFKTSERVFVVFGGAHALAIEPALHQLMEKQAAD